MICGLNLRGLEMHRTIILTVALLVCTLSETQAKSIASADKDDAPTIKIINLDIRNRILNLSYEISNNSKRDIWICDCIHEGYNFEVYLEKESQVLTIRKRLGILSYSDWLVQPFGKYIRLRQGEKKIESISLALPVNSVHVYKSIGSHYCPVNLKLHCCKLNKYNRL